MKDQFGGIDPPAHEIPRRTVDVRGRVEHEALLKDPVKCAALGLDHTFEVLVYLKRWGGWLDGKDLYHIKEQIVLDEAVE